MTTEASSETEVKENAEESAAQQPDQSEKAAGDSQEVGSGEGEPKEKEKAKDGKGISRYLPTWLKKQKSQSQVGASHRRSPGEPPHVSSRLLNGLSPSLSSPSKDLSHQGGPSRGGGRRQGEGGRRGRRHPRGERPRRGSRRGRGGEVEATGGERGSRVSRQRQRRHRGSVEGVSMSEGLTCVKFFEILKGNIDLNCCVLECSPRFTLPLWSVLGNDNTTTTTTTTTTVKYIIQMCSFVLLVP